MVSFNWIVLELLTSLHDPVSFYNRIGHNRKIGCCSSSLGSSNYVCSTLLEREEGNKVRVIIFGQCNANYSVENSGGFQPVTFGLDDRYCTTRASTSLSPNCNSLVCKQPGRHPSCPSPSWSGLCPGTEELSRGRKPPDTGAQCKTCRATMKERLDKLQ